MNKCGEVDISGKTIRKAHMHPASDRFTPSALLFFLRWAGEEMRGRGETAV